jgi:hypothetical protein
MDRQSALILTIIFFMVFIFLAYYGAKLTMLSTIVLATFISLILLNIFYPPNKITQDPNDFRSHRYYYNSILCFLYDFSRYAAVLSKRPIIYDIYKSTFVHLL